MSLAPREPVVVPRTLARGPYGLPRDVVLLSQRARLMEGMVASVAEKGYASTTLADIASRAGVSRSTLYEHFADKEACFIACYEEGAQALFEHMLRAGSEPGGPAVDRLRAGVRAFLEGLIYDPRYARTFLGEILAAGPRAAASHARVRGRFVQLMRLWYGKVRDERAEASPLPAEAFEIAVGGTHDLIAERVRRGEGERLMDLEDVIVGMWLALAGADEDARRAWERASARDAADRAPA